ncbi:hypothetical protein [Salinibacter altiplanensis]|uniref:hypothetical protein n=1 Tax=Salinibacter altiplanensis TaxID=1803181 RepID=UPI000C9FE3CF|nr:hypothetical protein [Salinibacter altiplanensis]
MSTGRISSLYISLLVFGLTFAFVPEPALGQSDDLNIYGFFQAQGRYVDSEDASGDGGYSSFRLPQLNLFFAKEFGDDFGAFVSTEFLNSYNSGEDFGIARLGEGWVQYEYGRALKVKGGLLIPKFNNLNEIKNRTPLLPYITRPFVYEQSYKNLFENGDYVPQRAYGQVYGTLPVGDVEVDYAAYVGNSDPGFLVSGDANYPVSGTDTTYSKLFGGRVGVNYKGVKAGVSGTVDEANMREVNLSIADVSVPAGLGDVDRYRIGADLSFDVNDFFAEGEVISVVYDLSDKQEAQWDGLRAQPTFAGVLGEDLDQLFYYGVAGYQITDKFDVHVLYNAVEESRSDTDLDSYGAGVSYRPVFPIRLKAGYRYTTIRDGAFNSDFFSLAASVTF